jgi:hypothetical protein
MMTVTAIAAGLMPILWNEAPARKSCSASPADDRRHGEPTP